MIAAALVLALAGAPAETAPPAPTLSRAQAEAMSPAELAARLVPGLAPKEAYRAKAYGSRVTTALSGVSIYTRPVEAGPGMCRTTIHNLQAQDLVSVIRQPALTREELMNWPMALKPPKTWSGLYMRPLTGAGATRPCGDMDPSNFFGVVPQDDAAALLASQLLRQAVVRGRADVQVRCEDGTKNKLCDRLPSALRSIPLDQVMTAGPSDGCPDATPGTSCIHYNFALTVPYGAWFVWVAAKDGKLTGLTMRRMHVVYH